MWPKDVMTVLTYSWNYHEMKESLFSFTPSQSYCLHSRGWKGLWLCVSAWLKDQQSQSTLGMIGLWGKLPKGSSCCDSEVWWEGGRGDRGLLRLSSSEEEGKCGCFGIDWCVSHPANFWASGWPFKNRKQHMLSAVSLITFLFPCSTMTKMCILSFLKMLNDS